MLCTEKGMPVIDTAPDSNYDHKILRRAFIAPDIQRDILAGRQPANSISNSCAESRFPH